MTSPREKLGLALGVAAMVGFSATVPVTRFAVGYLDPLFLTAGRASLAGIVAGLVLLVLRRKVPPRDTWGIFVLTGFCVLVSYPVFLSFGLRYVPASHGGVILGIMPLAVAAIATLLGYERPSAGFWLATAGRRCRRGRIRVAPWGQRRRRHWRSSPIWHGRIGRHRLHSVRTLEREDAGLGGHYLAARPLSPCGTHLPPSSYGLPMLQRFLASRPGSRCCRLHFVGQYFSFIASNFGMAMPGWRALDS